MRDLKRNIKQQKHLICKICLKIRVPNIYVFPETYGLVCLNGWRSHFILGIPNNTDMIKQG